MGIYFWALYSVPLIYTCMSVFMPVPCCFDFYGLIVQFDIRQHDISNFVLLSQAHCAMQGLLQFHINFCTICSSYVKYVIGFLVGTALNLQIVLGSMDILMISMNMVCASTQLYFLQSLSSVSYNFPSAGILHPWLGLFLGILFILKQL